MCTHKKLPCDDAQSQIPKIEMDFKIFAIFDLAGPIRCGPQAGSYLQALPKPKKPGGVFTPPGALLRHQNRDVKRAVHLCCVQAVNQVVFQKLMAALVTIPYANLFP